MNSELDPLYLTQKFNIKKWDTFKENRLKVMKNYIKAIKSQDVNEQIYIEAPYIQTQAHAERLMLWLTDKIMKPRKSVGIKLFPMPTLQLGDIVQIDYINKNNFNEISGPDKRFVVYSISYSKNTEGPAMEVHLSEVT